MGMGMGMGMGWYLLIFVFEGSILIMVFVLQIYTNIFRSQSLSKRKLVAYNPFQTYLYEKKKPSKEILQMV